MKRTVYKEIAQCLNGYGKVSKDIQEKKEEILDYIEKEILPSGSGFDCGCKIIREKFSEKIKISFDYHHMDENGYYCEWTEHTVIITPSLLFDINMRITGPDKRQSKDYFCDVFSDLLLRELNENEISHIVNIRRDIA